MFCYCYGVGAELSWQNKKILGANLANPQDPDRHHPPFHVDPQEHISEEKEGDGQ